MPRDSRKSTVWTASIGLLGLLSTHLYADINLELRGMPTNLCGGEVIHLGLFAVSDDAGNQTMAGAEVILVWDAPRLKLLGKTDNGPYSWLGSFFPNDALGDGLNAPFTGPDPFVPGNDGNAIYSVFGQFAPNPPAEATPAGLLITTFQFQAVGPGVGDLTVPLQFGASSHTSIVDGLVPGLDVTGTLPTASTSISCSAPPTAAVLGARWISAGATTTPDGCPASVGLRVIGDANNPNISCVDLYVQPSGILGEVLFQQAPASWGSLAVASTSLLPGCHYQVYADCGTEFAEGLGPSVSVTTTAFGDVDGTGLVDVDDIIIVLNGFSGVLPPGGIETIDLMPCTPNLLIDVDDVLGMLGAFVGTPFTDFCPAPCP